jgi:hypothetical protein
VSKRSGWDHNLTVTANGKGLVGHAGAVLLRKCADRTGLTAALSSVLPAGQGPGWWDRGQVLVNLAVTIVLGGTGMSDIALLAHQASVFGDPPSDSTVGRGLAALDDRLLRRVATVRARVRAHVWHLLTLRPGGFPWLSVAGKLLTGWIVIDIDATLITAHSAKTGAAVTFKKGFGFHPLGAWCANTSESLAMLLRPGNAGSNTVADHLRVLAAAIEQIPTRWRAKLLIRVDGAGATHDLLTHLQGLNTTRRTVYYTVGWAITAADETAIAALPAAAWDPGLHQDGEVDNQVGVAELTGLSTRQGWPEHQRLVVRRTRPAGRHKAKLTPSNARRAGATPSWPPTSPASPASAAPTSRNGSTSCTAPTPASKTGSAPTRPWDCAGSPPKTGRSTAAGSWPPTSPATWPPGPASWVCTTNPTSPTPNPTPCATGCGTYPPG